MGGDPEFDGSTQVCQTTPVFRPQRPRLGPLPRLLACLTLCGLIACSATTTDPLVRAGQDLLRTTRPPSDRAFADLNRFVAEQPGVAAVSASGLIEEPEETTRYAAVYTLALTAQGEGDIGALAGALDDQAEYLRALAAGSLIGLGHREAIPVLIELLSVTDEIPGSVPALFVDRFSSRALT
ncbi:MAG: hypothetical protein LC722_06545, partial [Actinobacteria bacterium]|nr:hypothetical protein [Actinomycetota bacterium]